MADRAGERSAPMEPTFFATGVDFRAWLERHHDSMIELLVR
jgi:hypothetical protein